MLSVLPYYIGFILPASVIVGYALGGAWTFMTLVVSYVLLPVLDALFAHDDVRENTPPPAGPDVAFRLVLLVWAPAQLLLVAWALHVLTNAPLTPIERIGVTLSVGVTTGGIGITFAHELLHRSGRLERALSELLMLSVVYPHFPVAHIAHHVHVGTPDDPDTAHAGEGFYRFLRRSSIGNIAAAWRFEAARLRARGYEVWSASNRMLRYAVCAVGLLVAIGAFFGARGLMFFLVQAAIAQMLLQATNYIEHYGLARRELAPGRYEPIGARHSWESRHHLTNRVLLNLARHADHHLVASRPYHTLRYCEDAPQLPAGYSVMVMLAFAPPLWRRVMDPRIPALRQ